MSDDALTSTFIFRPDGSEIELRYLALGLNPIVLIEPYEDDNDNVGFAVDATGINQDELLLVLESLVLTLKEGVPPDES